MLNTSLLNAANKVMNNPSPTQFTIMAQFICSTAGTAGFPFYPFQIEALTIVRDYEKNYADEIDLAFKISPKDYALLNDQGQNILCVLTITYTDKFGKILTSPKPIQTQYNVMLNDNRDIRKAVPDVHLYTEPSQDITVRLVETTVYNMRNTRTNGIHPVETISNVIYHTAQTFGITNVHLVPPDNSHTYDHIEIPSYQGISNVFSHLQEKNGIYNKGVKHYVTGNCLYVYPAYETAPVYDKSVIFYQVDQGRYVGSNSFHQTSGTTTSIVVNSQANSVDLSVHASENVGTGVTFVRASRLKEGITYIDPTKGAAFTQNPILTIGLAAARSMTAGLNNIKHIVSTDNPMPHLTKMSANQASLMNVSWQGADPFVLDPPHAVTYYYDENGAMVKKTGLIEKAVYRINRGQRMNAKFLYHCIGDLTLRLSPNTVGTAAAAASAKSAAASQTT